MKPHAVGLLLLFSAACALQPSARAQPDANPGAAPKVAPPVVRSSPFAADAGASVSEPSIRAHMSFLASDALNGRGSGTRDEWIAAVYLGSQMSMWGLEPMGDDGGFVQRVEIERAETAGPPVLTAGGASYVHGKDMVVQALAGTKIAGPLQRYKPGIEPAAGAVLLMPDPPAGGPSRSASVPALVLVRETPQARARWEAYATRTLTTAPVLIGVNAPPALRPTAIILNQAAYDAIAALGEGARVEFHAPVKASARSVTWNAVGRLPGSDPASVSEVILLSAHLDHVGSRAPRDPAAKEDVIFNGADDDASGSVAVLELAKALAQGPRPRRTIVFALFGSEETGGFGSGYFVEKPVIPLSQLVANLQFEMIGRPDPKVPPQTLWLTGYERSTLGPALAKQGARLVQDPHPEQSFFTRSDNIRFARRGVVAHTVSSYGMHKDYHEPSDEVRLIDFAHMTEAIRSMLEPIRWLANSGFKPDWLPGMKP